MAKYFLSWAPLASASCLITSKVCTNFPEFSRTQFRDAIGEEHLNAAQEEAVCLTRAQDFHHWCGNTNSVSVAATFKDKTQFYDPSACEAGWSLWSTFCYRFHLDLKSWIEAEEICRADDSHLASVHSTEENGFIHRLAHGLKVWIGYYRQQEQYTWSDDSQKDFTNFAKNCSGREHEADCHPNEVQQKWHHSSGDERSPFVCKRKARNVSVQNISAHRLLTEDWEDLRLTPHVTDGEKLLMKVNATDGLLLLVDKFEKAAKNLSELQATKNLSELQDFDQPFAEMSIVTWMKDLSCKGSTLATPRLYEQSLTATF